MALYCFWYRRACSRHAALGNAVPADSRLARHLQSCHECDSYWADMRQLSSELGSMVQVPRCTTALRGWSSAPATRSSSGAASRRALLGVAAAAGLVCSWMVWHLPGRLEVPASGEIVRVYPPKSGDERLRADVAAASLPNAPIETAGYHGFGLRRPSNRARLVWRSLRRHNPLRLEEPETAPVSAPPRSELVLAASTHWQEYGAALESEGEPTLANAAYQAEFEQRPSDTAAFDMGRTAEESGDMDQALTAYAGLLEAADRSCRPEKGSQNDH